MPKNKDPAWEYFDVVNTRTSINSKLPIVKCRLCNERIRHGNINRIRKHITKCPLKKDKKGFLGFCAKSEDCSNDAQNYISSSTSGISQEKGTLISKAISAVQNGGKLSHVSLKYNIPVSFLFLQITRLKLKDQYEKKMHVKSQGSLDVDDFKTSDGLVVSDRLYSQKIRYKGGVVVDKNIFKAIQECKLGLPIKEVAEEYGINHQTLKKKIKFLKKLKAERSATHHQHASNLCSKNDKSVSNAKVKKNNDGGRNYIKETSIPSTSKRKPLEKASFSKTTKVSSLKPSAKLKEDDAPLSAMINRLKEGRRLYLSSSMANAVLDVDRGQDFLSAAEANDVNHKILSKFCESLRNIPSDEQKNYLKIVVKFDGMHIENVENIAANIILCTPNPKIIKYSIAQMARAIISVNRGKSMASACKLHKVPYSSLFKQIARIGLITPTRTYKARRKLSKKELNQPLNKKSDELVEDE